LLAQVVERAGLGFLPTTNVPEPEAAALDHADRRRLGAGDVVAVYDLGGGTFDVAVFRRTPDAPGGAGFELLGPPQGIERLGGIDFDAAVLAHVDAALDGAVTAPPRRRRR
jgi:molecular chaperone DnaK (HSP70)